MLAHNVNIEIIYFHRFSKKKIATIHAEKWKKTFKEFSAYQAWEDLSQDCK